MKLLAAILGALALAAPALAAAPLPDLIVLGSSDPYSTWFVSTETFAAGGCAVDEGMITAGTHRLLRFDTETANIGNGDLRLGKPQAGDPNWKFFACHNHWHFVPYAEYRLLDMAGNIVGVGHKQSFCIEDTLEWDASIAKGRSYFYTCDRQGLSVGWADIYSAYLPGQWIEIDNVPAGMYWLEETVNYAGAIEESDYSNNTALVAVTVT